MQIYKKALTAIALSFMLILTGCSIQLGFPMNFERFSEELSDHELAQSPFDTNDPLLEKRMVLISGGVNKSMAKVVCRQLVYLDEQSYTEPITLLINSGGGDCTSYHSITTIIKSIHAPVDTVNVGVCASMGALLIQSATGKRYAIQDTSFLIHEPSGSPDKTRETYKDIQEKIFKARCKLPEDWLPIGDQTHIFSADEALKYQFVDEVIESIDMD